MDQPSLQLGPALPPPAGSLFDDRLLLTLAAANDAFLQLATELYQLRRGAVLGLPPAALEPLAVVGPRRRQALAELPFALFDLRFHDPASWQPLAAGAPRVLDLPAPARLPVEAEFSRHALAVAWHLSAVSEAAARLALGACDAALLALRRAPLGGVEALAPAVTGLLSARFGGCAPFWQLFVRCALTPEPASRQALRLLGLQLLGLEAARVGGLLRRGRRVALP